MTPPDNLFTAPFGDKRTPRQLLIDAMNKVEGAEIAVLVWKDSEGYVQTGWSNGDMTARVGLCEVAKVQMMDAARDDGID